MRPVSPPGMPKANSMPASSRTRTTACGTSISSGIMAASYAGRSTRSSAPGAIFRGHPQLHLADLLDAAAQAIAGGQPLDAGRRAGRDEVAGPQRQNAGEEADVLAQPADHVAGVGPHGRLAVLLHFDGEVLRLVDLAARSASTPPRGVNAGAPLEVPPALVGAPPRGAAGAVPAETGASRSRV